MTMTARVPVLDGLRGVAILLVLFLHLGPSSPWTVTPTALIDRLYLRTAQTGWMGVDLFFVLSGFLITGILYDTKASAHYFRQFYARRVLRIFPLYYAALALFLIVLPTLRPDHWVARDLQADAFWFWTYLYNMKVSFSGFSPTSALGHFWSLAVEEQFYLIWPFVVLWLGRRHLLATCAALIVIALLCRIALAATDLVVLPDVWMPARMDALGVGAFIAVYSRTEGGMEHLARWARPTVAIAAVPLCVLFVLNVGLATIGHTLLALFFGATLVVALTSKPASVTERVLSSRILGFFGRYSYALYVFHHPLLWFKPALIGGFTGVIAPVLGSQLPGYLLWLVVATTVSIALALVSWHLIENPFLSLKRFFPYQSEAAPRERTPLLPTASP